VHLGGELLGRVPIDSTRPVDGGQLPPLVLGPSVDLAPLEVELRLEQLGLRAGASA